MHHQQPGAPATRRKISGDVGISIGSDAMTSKGIDTLLRHACSTGTLRISNRGLKAIPKEVFSLQSLDYSDKKWWQEAPLTVLDFSHNEIRDLLASSSVPPARMAEDFAAMFHALRLLVGSYNELEVAPTPLLSVCSSTITKIDLSHNKLRVFDPFYAPGPNNGPTHGRSQPILFPSLVELDISNNQIAEVFGIAAACPQLEKLDVSNNKLVSFESMHVPSAVQFPILRHLSIHHNQLEAFGRLEQPARGPQSRVPMFPQLVSLDASYNALTVASFSPEAGGVKLPPSLVTLNLQVNRIAGIVSDASGASFLECPALKELYLGYNKMATPPPHALEQCTSLQMIDASNNLWSDVCCVLTCPNLSRLDVQNNNLSTLPPQLGFFKKLTAIVLDGNPMRAIRRDIVAKGTVELMKYLRSRGDESLASNDNPKSNAATIASAPVTYLPAETFVPASTSSTGNPSMSSARPRKVDDRPFATELNRLVISEEDKARDEQCLRTGEHTGTMWDLSMKKQPASASIGVGKGPSRGVNNSSSAAADLPAVVNIQLNLKELHARMEEDFRQGVHTIKICRQPRVEHFDFSFLWPFPNARELDASECPALSLVSVPTPATLQLQPPAVLPAIQTLNLSRCALFSAETGMICFAQLCSSPYVSKLTRLDLSFNKPLSMLPDEFALLGKSLRYLSLNFCRLQQFPMVLGHLHELHELSMNSCGLANFPSDEEMATAVGPSYRSLGFAEASWPKLQLLDLGNNNLTTVPYSIGKMQNHLRSLVLEGNAIKWLRPQTCAKGTAAVLQFLVDKMPA